MDIREIKLIEFIEALEELPSSQRVIVRFTHGDCFNLSGFCGVDKTIWPELACTGFINDVYSAQSAALQPGSVLEFIADEVESAKLFDCGTIVYQKEN